MTLITYLSRVHFADGVLEVALSSELELNNFGRPLLVSEKYAVTNEFAERIFAGLPFWCKSTSYDIPQNSDAQQAVTKLQQVVREVNADVVIAFGSSLALSVADACCRYLSAQSEQQTAGSSIVPNFFAVPGVDGMPTMSMPRHGAVRGTRLGAGIQPDTVVIDPTLILGESIERTAVAAANSMARCLSAHFSNGYNPPADGIAIDGLKRIVRNLPAIVTEDTLDMRRELMAASLNATLAMQKEAGVAYELCENILRSTENTIDEGALMRLLIVIEAELMEATWTLARLTEVRSALGVPEGEKLHNWLLSLFQELPLPGTLGELGVKSSDIRDAAMAVAANRSALVPSAECLEGMLNGVTLRSQPMSAMSEFG